MYKLFLLSFSPSCMFANFNENFLRRPPQGPFIIRHLPLTHYTLDKLCNFLTNEEKKQTSMEHITNCWILASLIAENFNEMRSNYFTCWDKVFRMRKKKDESEKKRTMPCSVCTQWQEEGNFLLNEFGVCLEDVLRKRELATQSRQQWSLWKRRQEKFSHKNYSRSLTSKFWFSTPASWDARVSEE